MHGGDPTRDLNLERPTLYPLHHVLSQNWRNVFFTGLDGGEDPRAQAASLSSRFPPVGEFQEEEEEQGCRQAPEACHSQAPEATPAMALPTLRI